jgi:hypothetical protein
VIVVKQLLKFWNFPESRSISVHAVRCVLATSQNVGHRGKRRRVGLVHCRGLELVGGVNVGDGLLAVTADSEHGLGL